MKDARLDHVAIAVRNMRAAIPFYTDALGAAFLFAGEQKQQEFRWAQFRLPGGGKIELVTPIGSTGFVARFLERRGEGVHHITMKVPDISSAVADLRAREIPLFNVHLDNPSWMEAFIHPRDANGALMQIVQSPFSDEDMARHHAEPHEAGHRHLHLEDLIGDTADNSPERPST